MSSKVVICGSGFIGNQIARAVTRTQSIRVQISSRKPQKSHEKVKGFGPSPSLLPPVPADITSPSSLRSAFKDASFVVSLVGIMHGTPQDFDNVQWKGAENVAQAARDAGAKLIHFSAIGANPASAIPYTRTKGLGELAVFEQTPDATIIRPSLVFGPDDDFFNRFARLSKYLPLLPVFGGGTSLFQPVFVDDLADLVELILCNDSVEGQVKGKIIEAGGPEVYTYRQLMEAVLKYTRRSRPIISIPFSLGYLQGAMLEQLPVNLLTITRAQVEQLKLDNVVNRTPSENVMVMDDLFSQYCKSRLRSIHDILPSYL